MRVLLNMFNAEVIDDRIFVISECYDKKVACFDDKENQWNSLTNMNVHKLLMSTCVIKNLPNASDYAYKHRDKLMEEKRKKMLYSTNQ
ncbi:hypothetical protein L798_15446 [Zootermopsis nevadensis]|uniref:Kelch-like protein 10 n=1 Tax=Zootermopsis nevadensis TaxID=136037 RepID=A0A067RHC6_ZOONE|nr:hypothetical protein L798_15446 [Zootermopsis nevadensis]